MSDTALTETAETTVGICNTRGLHARASAKFVKLASTFDAEVHVTRDGGKTAVSEDGIGWVQQANTFAGTDIRSVAYGNGNFVAVGAGGKIAYWTP